MKCVLKTDFTDVSMSYCRTMVPTSG